MKCIDRLERPHLGLGLGSNGIRKEEYMILKAIIVSNCDVADKAIEETAALARLREALLSSLYDCVTVIR